MTMTERRDDMLELDACLARVPMPDALEARIIAASTVGAVRPSPVRRSLVVGLAFATGVAMTVLALRGWTPEPEPTVTAKSLAPTVPEPEPELEERVQPAPGLSLISEACAWSSSDELLRFEAGCRIRLAQPAMELEIWAPTRLSPIADGVAVHDGAVLFSVEHVDDHDRPARVAVSGGTIEVLGTRFAIHQARDDGHVDLIDGAIRFRRLDGEVEAVEPGQRYRWGGATPEPSEASEPPQPHAPDPGEAPTQPEPDTSGSLADGLAEVARLRRAGEIDAAIAKLDMLAREQSDPRTLEVISYERGTLVERSTTASRACEFWSEHLRRFPSGRYDDEVERRLAQLECVPE